MAAQAQTDLARPLVLVIDFNRLYLQSSFGERISQDIVEESASLAVENQRKKEELEAEERELTELRQSLTPEEFRARADAFDQKVREVRASQLQKARDLERRRFEIPPEFQAAVVPILESLMRETGAIVVMERDSVIWNLPEADITDEVLERVNQTFAEGLLTSSDD